MSGKTSRRSVVSGLAATLLGGCAGSQRPERTAASAASESTASSQSEAVPSHPAAFAKRALGRTGEQVSMLGLGGYHLGIPTEAESIRIVQRALDEGISFFDNCWDYHGGESERRLGKALRGARRQQAFVMTKLDGRTREPATRQLEQSLKRLETDRIDLVQMHEIIRDEDPGWVFGAGGAMEALIAARQAGKLRFIGFTGHKDPKIHLAMLETAERHGFRFDTVQLPLNVMDPHYRSFEQNVLPVLVERQIGVLGMKPLAAGDILKSGVASARECLRYALSLPTSVVITGCDNMTVLEQALDAAREFQPLTADEKRALLARTAEAARSGVYEAFKNTRRFDGTEHNRKWLTSSEI